MRRTALVFAALAITLYIAPLRGAGNVDGAFQAFWNAADPKAAEKTIGAIVASGVDFDTAMNKLKAGRTFAKEKTGLLRIPQQVGGEPSLIKPAEALNEEAANALLKTLEEPPERHLLVLTAQAEADLLPTIVSRCH